MLLPRHVARDKAFLMWKFLGWPMVRAIVDPFRKKKDKMSIASGIEA